MADQKLSALTEATGAAEQDDLYLVTDTTTSPVSKKISFDNLQNSFTDISLDKAQFDTSMTGTTTEGQVAYNSNNGALEYGTSGGFPIELGKMTTLPRRVKNTTGATITKGTVVYISGVQGNDPLISKAIATSDATSAFTIGVTGEDISDNGKGHVVTFGLVTGLNLSSYTAGDTVYLSGTVAGEFTATKSLAPLHYVRVGIVTKATASGELFVTVLNGFELEELHDVSIIGAGDKDIISYETSTGLWKNKTIGTLKTDLDLSGTNTGDITVTDSATVNFTLTGQNLTADVIASGVSLGGLSDVDIVSLQDNDLLKFDGNTNKWINTKEITVDTLTVNGQLITNQSSAFFGDGSDGAIDFDGYNEYPNFSTFNGTDTYTLTRDIYANTLIVGYFITLKTGGYRIFVSDTLVNSNYIHNEGNSAVNNTLGTGGAGGFFKAGGNGVAGLTGAGANGTVPTAQTNLVAGTGGRGQSAYSNQTAFEGLSPVASTTTPPSNAIGGSKMVNNVFAYQFSFIPSGAAANMQFTPSQGGGAGAKSAAGTSAVSGGGGGGGGTVFIAARSIVNFGTISASGGNGGDANGTNANLGGGGGGGGGVVCVVYDNNASFALGDIRAFGGAGGLSVEGTNGTRAVAIPYHLQNSTAQTVYVTPTNFMDKKSVYMISIHTFDDIISTVEHPNYKIELIDIVAYDSIAFSTKYLQLYYAYFDPAVGEVVNQFENQSIKFTTLNGTCTNMKIVIDEIQNCDGTNFSYSHAINYSDSTTNLTVDLGYVPTTGNMVYSVFAKDGGAASPTVGTGNTIIRKGNTIPYLYTEVSLNRQTNNLTWTGGATQAAAISVDIDQVASMRDGVEGWDGKVVLLPQ